MAHTIILHWRSDLEKVKKHDNHLVIGDFYSLMCKDSHILHPVVIGPHCFYDETNDNGHDRERLVSLCQDSHNLETPFGRGYIQEDPFTIVPYSYQQQMSELLAELQDL